MTQWMFYFDQERCIGCKTCTLACKEWNEGRRGDAKLSGFTDEDLARFATPSDWHAGTGPRAFDADFNRRNTMKETWRHVTFHEFGKKAPNIAIVPISMGCNHCSDPACLKVCPMKAIRKEEKYGAVINDPEKCIGCGLCQKACPWHVPQYFESLEKTPLGAPNHPKMSKCDMCIDRLNAGLKPACVASCPGRALECLPADEMKRRHPDAVRTAPGFDREKAEITRPNIVFNPKSIRV
ncbi:4Fe-4S dicluster domain-containing protein [Mesosutterella multiformis]|jgi:anaerobic dimethyl sulfoxide reductase subunit B (iron-sulfur subunit)|uniref:4Fe-4S dicluster domain-containing protein n=1 Tax=Mesosutterella multiformis TaxID=2259133 RepID=UPI000F614D87|nr:4Fe-4S dicluster domain-containing protein [Mesosutterella multiformis]MBM6983407.1 4Fe-4S dicluster domain-containing protein [Mesosutterella multiformis]GCB31423.1 dimethylsulfoxide reductase, chain B [Mesosutterella multiformis]